MENASKALIIAGAILITILLISVGILIFNSISGTTDTAGLAGDAMEIAARKERVKMILSSIDLSDDNVFFEYIRSNYGTWEYIYGDINNITLYNLSTESARELCELIVQRSVMYYGDECVGATIHITRGQTSAINGVEKRNKIYYDESNHKIIDMLEENEKYHVGMFRNNETEGYSVRIREL